MWHGGQPSLSGGYACLNQEKRRGKQQLINNRTPASRDVFFHGEERRNIQDVWCTRALNFPVFFYILKLPFPITLFLVGRY